MAQYVGLSDFIGRLITEIPNYGERFGRLLLSLTRRVIANPVGFMSMVVGLSLAYYAVDSLINGLLTSMQASVNSAVQYINQWASQLTVGSCSPTDFLCMIRNGVLSVVQFIIRYVFVVLANVLLWLISQLISALDYFIRVQMYAVGYVLCNYVAPAFATVTTAYVGGKIITGMWRLLGRGSVGSIFGRVFGTIFTGASGMILTYIASNVLLNLAFTLVGVKCDPQHLPVPQPTLNVSLVIPTPPPLTSKAVTISEGATYSLSFASPSTVTLSLTEKSGYSLGLTRTPILTARLLESVSYALNVVPPAQTTVMASLGESVRYALAVAYGKLVLVVLSESTAYSLSVSVLPPSYCVVQGASVICYETVTSAYLPQSPVAVTESVSTSGGT